MSFSFPTFSKTFTDHSHRDGDLFRDEPTPGMTTSQLSPAAQAFTPGGSVASAIGAGNSSTHIAGGNVATGPGATGVHNLLAGSVPDDLDSRLVLAQQVDEMATDLGTMALRYGAQAEQMLLHTTTLREGIFSTDDRLGRAVMVLDIPTSLPESAIRGLVTVSPSHPREVLAF